MAARGARPGGRKGAKLILAKAHVVSVSKARELSIISGCQTRRIEGAGE
jgi:hypothetical protein